MYVVAIVSSSPSGFSRWMFPDDRIYEAGPPRLMVLYERPTRAVIYTPILYGYCTHPNYTLFYIRQYSCKSEIVSRRYRVEDNASMQQISVLDRKRIITVLFVLSRYTEHVCKLHHT